MSFSDKLMKPWYWRNPGRLAKRLFCKKPLQKHERLVQMAWGGELSFDISGGIGWGAFLTGVVDLALSELVCQLVAPGDHVLDVGANVGGITCLLARNTGESGTVHAFEPHPVVSKRLTRNCDRNLGQLSKVVKIHEKAAGDANGLFNLIEDPCASDDGQAFIGDEKEGCITHRVAVCRLSDVVDEREYAFMKLDVEGHEEAALKGAETLVSQKKIKNILFEDHQGPGSPAWLYLQKCGYHLYSFGWEFGGVRVADADKGDLTKTYEAPNYWASSDPLGRDFFRGWRCLDRVGAI